jgi:hypothetical protein
MNDTTASNVPAQAPAQSASPDVFVVLVGSEAKWFKSDGEAAYYIERALSENPKADVALVRGPALPIRRQFVAVLGDVQIALPVAVRKKGGRPKGSKNKAKTDGTPAPTSTTKARKARKAKTKP